MQDEPIERDPQQRTDLDENLVLHMMVDDPTPGLWSVEELSKALGRIRVADALPALHAMGLIHCHGDFVWPTRAAMRTIQIENAF
jgi:hypothetical protein